MDAEKSSLGRKIRTTEDDLRISGTAVVALGALSSLKLCVSLFGQRHEMFKNTSAETAPESLIVPVLVIFLLFVGMLCMSVHAYIGISARRTAERKNAPPYILLTVLLLILTINSIIQVFLMVTDKTLKNEYAVSIVIDITLVYTLIHIIIATFRLRKLRRSDAQSEEQSSLQT